MTNGPRNCPTPTAKTGPKIATTFCRQAMPPQRQKRRSVVEGGGNEMMFDLAADG